MWGVTFCWHFLVVLNTGRLETTTTEISVDMLECDRRERERRESPGLFRGQSQCSGRWWRGTQRLNGNNWSADNGWLKALSATLEDFNIRVDLERGSLSGQASDKEERGVKYGLQHRHTTTAISKRIKKNAGKQRSQLYLDKGCPVPRWNKR